MKHSLLSEKCTILKTICLSRLHNNFTLSNSFSKKWKFNLNTSIFWSSKEWNYPTKDIKKLIKRNLKSTSMMWRSGTLLALGRGLVMLVLAFSSKSLSGMDKENYKNIVGTYPIAHCRHTVVTFMFSVYIPFSYLYINTYRAMFKLKTSLFFQVLFLILKIYNWIQDGGCHIKLLNTLISLYCSHLSGAPSRVGKSTDWICVKYSNSENTNYEVYFGIAKQKSKKVSSSGKHFYSSIIFQSITYY